MQSALGVPRSGETVRLFRKFVRLFRKFVPLFRKYVPLFRKFVPLFRKFVPLFRKSVPLFRKFVPLFRKSVPLFLTSAPSVPGSGECEPSAQRYALSELVGEEGEHTRRRHGGRRINLGEERPQRDLAIATRSASAPPAADRGYARRGRERLRRGSGFGR